MSEKIDLEGKLKDVNYEISRNRFDQGKERSKFSKMYSRCGENINNATKEIPVNIVNNAEKSIFLWEMVNFKVFDI